MPELLAGRVRLPDPAKDKIRFGRVTDHPRSLQARARLVAGSARRADVLCRPYTAELLDDFWWLADYRTVRAGANPSGAMPNRTCA